MRYIGKKKKILQIIYTICFFFLVVIDWANGSLDGRTQMTVTNLTGIIVAIVIMSSWKVRELIKLRYFLWLAFGVIVLPLLVVFLLKHNMYTGQVISATLNVFIFGFILIGYISRMKDIIRCNCINHAIILLWGAMLILMLLSVNENIWPIWFLIIFGLYYFTDFKSDVEEMLYESIVNGIIVGFFVLQGLALLFRPYDIVRYQGMYINPNYNALFYLMTYSAFLCKWFWINRAGGHWIYKFLVGTMAGAMYGFCFFTGSKTSIGAMILITVPFILMTIKDKHHKIRDFFLHWIFLVGISLISIPVVYFSIRYMPTIHLHPLFFEGEYNVHRVLPGDPRDSEKYISFETAIESSAGRLLYYLRETIDSANSAFVLKVKAAESEFVEPEYFFTEEEYENGIDPILARFAIQSYFFRRLNLEGHSNDFEGAPIHPGVIEPHAHNVFIQMAFLYGIPAGMLFAVMCIIYFWTCMSLLKKGEGYRACVIICFLLAFILFGLFEIDWMCGQLPFTLFFLLFRDSVRKKCVST